MAINGYGINEQSGSEGNHKDSECYGESQHHSFVKVIPVEFNKQKFPNTTYNSQNISSQEDIRTNYPVLLNEKDQSEMSSIASVSTLSSVMNRAMSATSAAMAEKPSPPRVPNGQCKNIKNYINLYTIIESFSVLFSVCFPEQWDLCLC